MPFITTQNCPANMVKDGKNGRFQPRKFNARIHPVQSAQIGGEGSGRPKIYNLFCISHRTIQNKLSFLHQRKHSFCYDLNENTNSEFDSFSWEQNFFRIENPSTRSRANLTHGGKPNSHFGTAFLCVTHKILGPKKLSSWQIFDEPNP